MAVGNSCAVMIIPLNTPFSRPPFLTSQEGRGNPLRVNELIALVGLRSLKGVGNALAGIFHASLEFYDDLPSIDKATAIQLPMHSTVLIYIGKRRPQALPTSARLVEMDAASWFKDSWNDPMSMRQSSYKSLSVSKMPTEPQDS